MMKKSNYFYLTGGSTTTTHLGVMNDSGFMPVLPETDEFLDGDIDRSEFDKYLSGSYGTNHVSYSSYVAIGGNGTVASDGPAAASATPSFVDCGKENGNNELLPHQTANDYTTLLKSESIYETIPVAGSSLLSSALADVRSVYYDC